VPIEDTFTYRHVKHVLNLLEVDDDDDVADQETFRFDAKLELTRAQVRTLRRFVEDQNKKKKNVKERLGMLHDVDLILNSYIVSAVAEQMEEFEFSNLFQDYSTKFKNYLPSSEDLFWCILFGGALGLTYLLWIGLPLWKWFFLLLVLSSVWHWGHMYKKAVLKKHIALMDSHSIPPECYNDKGWKSYFFGSNKKCAEYHEALLVDPLWEVTPTMAVAETITVFVVQPMEKIGEHLGKFFSGLTSQLSWLSTLPVLLFVFMLIMMIFVMMFGYHIRLPLFLASIEPQPRQVPHPQPQVTMLEQKIEELQLTIKQIQEIKDVQVKSVKLEGEALTCHTSNSNVRVEQLALQSESSVVAPAKSKNENAPEDVSTSDPSKYSLLEQKIDQLQLTISRLEIDKKSSSEIETVMEEVCLTTPVFDITNQSLQLSTVTQKEFEVTTASTILSDPEFEVKSDGDSKPIVADQSVVQESKPKEEEFAQEDPSNEEFEWVNPNTPT